MQSDKTGFWLVVGFAAGGKGHGGEDEGGDFQIRFHFVVFSLVRYIAREVRKPKNEKEYQRFSIHHS